MASVAHIIRRRRARQGRKQQRQQTNRVFGAIFGIALFLVVLLPVGVLSVVGLSYYGQLAAGLPTPQQSSTLDPVVGTSRLVDRTGQTLLWAVEDPLGDQRQWLRLDDLPGYLVQATLLREDPDFLRVARFAPMTTANRLACNYLERIKASAALYQQAHDMACGFMGELAPDPSLTGRLVRNAIAPPPEPVTAAYRAREYALVSEINRLYTPEAVLEWHLNTNFYGNSAYGIDAAAQIYFGKRAADLTLDEVAMLAAIPTAPQYNPLDDETAARGRQSEVLRDLLLNNVISQAQFSQANDTVTPLNVDEGQQPLVAPEYATYARRQAEHILDGQGYNGTRLVARGGLTITTALDIDLYEQLNCLRDAHLAQLSGTPAPIANENCPALAYLPETSPVSGAAPDTGAVALLDVRSGELVAAVGEITATERQPGPILYPFVYMRAFRAGLTTPARMVLDVPLRFSGAAEGLIYTPTNPDGSFQGPLNLRDAMAAGLLPPAVQIASTEGIDGVLFEARQIGMSSLDLPTFDLNVLERGGEVSVLDATYAYATFAALGQMRGVPAQTFGRGSRPRDPVAVLKIEDADGNMLWEYDDTERALSTTPIMDEGLSYLVNDVLADRAPRVQTLGAGNVLESSRPQAVVYGTAGDSHNWTIGYSPNLAVGVWLGRTDDAPLSLSGYGTDGAGGLWRAVSEYAHDRYGLPAEGWRQPPNIVEARVCDRSGLRPNEACPQRTEIFLEGTVPQEPDTYWEAVTVNNQNDLLATANTPTSLREERVYFEPPPDALEWWEANQLPLPPTEFDTVTRPDIVQTTVILRPELLDYVSGQVDIRGSLDAENLQYYQLAYGDGLNPTEWIAITEQRTDYTPGQSLGTWDTTGLDGLYNLRLTAVMNDNSIDPYVIQVTVDNTPPTIELSAGEPGEVFTFLDDDVIPLVATVEDNVTIDYVEFYHNGAFVGVDEAFPYGYAHPIARVGRETFSAVVFDAAGNQANSELELEVLRGGT